jgi:tetratricopeptide (TPR) repeat protein
MEALRAGKFKDAIEHFKKLVKQEPRPEWRAALADAYIGRAKALAAKGMFKEAEIVLGNAVASDGTVKDPLFLLQCLIRQGQFQKALVHALIYLGAEAAAVMEAAELPELTAALFLFQSTKAEPSVQTLSVQGPSARAKWFEAANAALAALNAWIEGKSEAEIDPLLARIPMRSPFKALRLIVKSLLTAPHDHERARRLLDAVTAQSPFAPLRLAVEASFPAGPMELLETWSRASAEQRSFAAEACGGQAAPSKLLSQLLEAENSGPAALFAFLLKHSVHLPEGRTRGACLDLLPRIPDRVAQFEKAFGPLRESERHRIFALSAEASEQWARAEKHWCAMAAEFEKDASREAKLSAGVVYRHLADLARREDAIEGEGYGSDPIAFYLKASLNCDAECLPALLRLIEHHRHNGENKEWHALTEDAAQRFPEESAVLLQAIDSATARKAYKKAAGFARKLLTLDPISQPARQRMIDLQISHARKQMQGKRAGLAWKELSDAAQWERADSPDAGLRINQGLVGLRLDQGALAEARLREGVEVAGGGLSGWFRAALEEALLLPSQKSPIAIVGLELTRAANSAPDRPQLAAIVAAMGAPSIRAQPKVAAALVFRIRAWLQRACSLVTPAAEFHALGDMLLRAGAYDLLRDFALAGKRREPGEPAWRFYEIVARTKNNPELLSMREEDELTDMQDQARCRQDYHWYNRVERYFDSRGDDPAAKQRAKRRAAAAGAEPPEELKMLLTMLMNNISPEEVQRLVKKLGRAKAIAAIAERLCKSPLAHVIPGMTPANLSEFAEVLVDFAAGGNRGTLF